SVDRHSRSETMFAGSGSENFAKHTIVLNAQTPGSNAVGRLAHPVHSILLKDAVLDRIRKDAAEEAYRTCRSPSATANDSTTAALRLYVGLRLPRHDIANEAIDIRLSDVLDTTSPKQRNDMTVDPTLIDNESGCLLGSPALPPYETPLGI